MTGPPALRELQEAFHRLLRAPEGVARGIEQLTREGRLAPDAIPSWIEGSDNLDATARLDIYASMYFYRLRDILAEEFDRTAKRIGEVHFHNLITDYLLAHPPSAWSLREAGAALPGFLANHALAGSHPAIADVAAIERARLEVFDARDEDVLDRERFLAATAADPEGFRLRCAEAIRLFEVDARALGWWSEPESERAPDAAAVPARQHVLVFRKNLAVFHRPCLEDEARCLEAIRSGETGLGDLAEHLLGHDRSAEETGERFAALLELWVDNRLLVAPPASAPA